MTVAELIKELQKVEDQNAIVYNYANDQVLECVWDEITFEDDETGASIYWLG